MDHRTTMVGVTSALEFCMRLSSKIDTVIESWHGTPPLMFALHNELSDLVVVLDSTRAATEIAGLDASKQNARLLDDLGIPLTEAYRIMTAVEDLVVELVEARDGKTRGRVLVRNGKAATFKDRLRGVRIVLHDCLLLHNVYGYQIRS